MGFMMKLISLMDFLVTENTLTPYVDGNTECLSQYKDHT